MVAVVFLPPKVQVVQHVQYGRRHMVGLKKEIKIMLLGLTKHSPHTTHRAITHLIVVPYRGSLLTAVFTAGTIL